MQIKRYSDLKRKYLKKLNNSFLNSYELKLVNKLFIDFYNEVEANTVLNSRYNKSLLANSNLREKYLDLSKKYNKILSCHKILSRNINHSNGFKI